MSKRNDDHLAQDQTDQNPAGENIEADNPGSGENDTPPGDTLDSDENDAVSENLTIEEHAKKQDIDAPVFAAVMQSNGWASGKKVPTAVFTKAVNDFLSASMGGQ